MKKKIVQVAIILIGLVALVGYVFWKEGVTEMWEKLKEVDYRFIALAMLSMILSLVFDGICIHIVRLRFQPCATLWSSLHCGFVSTMFGYISPFQAGYIAYGIAYLSSNQGMKPSDSSAVLLMKLIHYTIAAIVTHVVLILFNYKLFDFSVLLWVFVLIGIAFSVLYMVFLQLVPRFSKPFASIACKLIRLGSRIRLIRHPDESCWKAKVEIHNLKTNLSRKKLGFWPSAALFICCCLSFMAVYFVSWFIYLAFSPDPMLSCNFVLTGQVLCQIIQQISPIPGGLGIVDTAFTQVMNTIYGQNLNVAMLLWRLVSLYAIILIGFIMLFTIRKREKNKAGATPAA